MLTASFPATSFKVLMLTQHGQLMSCLVQELVNGRSRSDGACVISVPGLWPSLPHSPETDNIQELPSVEPEKKYLQWFVYNILSSDSIVG